MINLGATVLVKANRTFRHTNTIKMFKAIDVYMTRLVKRKQGGPLKDVFKFKKYMISRILFYGKVPLSYISVIKSGFNKVLLRMALRFGSNDSMQAGLHYYMRETGLSMSSKLKGNCGTVSDNAVQLSFPWKPSVVVTENQSNWLVDNGYLTK